MKLEGIIGNRKQRPYRPAEHLPYTREWFETYLESRQEQTHLLLTAVIDLVTELKVTGKVVEENFPILIAQSTYMQPTKKRKIPSREAVYTSSAYTDFSSSSSSAPPRVRVQKCECTGVGGCTSGGRPCSCMIEGSQCGEKCWCRNPGLTCNNKNAAVPHYMDDVVDLTARPDNVAADLSPVDKVMAEINSLIGLTLFKELAASFVAREQDRALQMAKGGAPAKQRDHILLMGPPGVGKTRCAVLLAKLLHALKFVSKGQLHEA